MKIFIFFFLKVSFNYRVSALGFFNIGFNGVFGNQALFDMVAALEWVQDNIETFGGDPEQVTIFGESAGSWAASYLSVSPLAKGLFSRAILQSGSWTHPSRMLSFNEAVRSATYGAEMLNCSNGSEDEIMECLQAANLDDILMLMQYDGFFNPPSACVDGDFLPKFPHEIVADGEINTNEIIIGANQDEGLLISSAFVLNPELYQEMQNDWARVGPRYLFGRRYQGDLTDIEQLDVDQAFEIVQHYMGAIENFNEENFENITRIFTDQYWYCTHSYANLLQGIGVTVFQYLFSYKGKIIVQFAGMNI